MAVLCFLAAIGAVFLASPEQLMTNDGVRNSGGGDMFRGLTALLGDLGARVLFGFLLLGLGALFWKSSDERKSEKRRQVEPRK